MFRDDFVWGVASSAYQSEGTDIDDGRGKCIWDTFYEEGRIHDKKSAIKSCDHMHHYEEDYALMEQLGIKAYRFSISWSRLMPEGIGRVNEKAVKLYRDMILSMRRHGIEPYLTMYHWEFPEALQEKGGWLNEDVIQWFGEYAKVIAENFTDIVEYIFTLNEPQCFVGLGHLSGVHAPGKKLPMKDTFQVAHNALRAHGQAVINLRKYAKRDIKIGFAPTCGVAYPYTNSKEDIEAARKVYFGFYQPDDNWTWNVAWYSDPVIFGKYPEEGMEKYKEYLPKITEDDMKLISQPLDFIGQNIYNGYFVRAGKDGMPEKVDRPEGFPFTGSKWPYTPECLYWGIKFIYERYKMPIYVTENGVSEPDRISSDGMVHDTYRQEYLDRYISELQKVVDEGADVRGYFLWTFLDNFEWDKGYMEKFGIIHVDFETQKRTVKDSAYWYRDTIMTNGANLLINKKPRPVLFIKPELKERIWGGSRLMTDFGYECDKKDGVGECWAVSAHEEADCKIDGGYYGGRTLSDLFANEPELFGNVKYDKFPLLTKIIDAKDDLSIQVHPDDEYARINENGIGKTECWYILDCPEDASLVIGNNASSKEELKDMIDNGRWNELCSRVKIKKGDFLQINPGTLHAITAGVVILETQQSSDITYRVYDYDRETNGVKRELHLKQSIDVLKAPDVFTEERVVHTKNAINEKALLESNQYYKVYELNIQGEYDIVNDAPFLICSVVEGYGIINSRAVKKGDHFIIPSGCGPVKAEGNMLMILSTV